MIRAETGGVRGLATGGGRGGAGVGAWTRGGWRRSRMWMAARMTPTAARPARPSRVTASAWAETGRKAPRAAWPGSRPARLRYRVHLFRLAEIPDPAPA